MEVESLYNFMTDPKMNSNNLKDAFPNIITYLSKWAEKCGLGVNPAKTELVLFTRKHTRLSFTRVKWYDVKNQ